MNHGKRPAKAQFDDRRRILANTPLVIVDRPIASLKAHPRNARKHDDRQLDLMKRSIQVYGFVNPVLIDADGTIIAGHGRYEAALRLPSSGRAVRPDAYVQKAGGRERRCGPPCAA